MSQRTTDSLNTGSPQTVPVPKRQISPLAQAIAVLLVVGVSLSAAMLVLGLVLLSVTGRTGYHETLAPAIIFAHEGSVAFPRTVADVWQGALALRPFAVIEVGVLLLIATPVLRVAASILLFWLEGDRLYTIIAALLLALLFASVIWVS